MKTKEDAALKCLVERLTRIFPKITIFKEGHYIDSSEEDYSPPVDLDWYDIIKKLNENGLEIVDSKRKK